MSPPRLLQKLADFVATAELQPDERTRQLVVDALIDVFGCILAGSTQAVTLAARNAVALSGAIANGSGAPVFGMNLATTRPAAAMLNATAGHAFEYDDWEYPGNTHPSVVLAPAILAAGAGMPLTPRAFIEAYLVGFETIARLGEGLNFDHYDRGWHSTATLGVIGAAASVARLRGLDSAHTANALALSISRSSGFTGQFGSDAKPLQAGFAAEGGIIAALLAEAGLTGQAHMLEHDTGFNTLMAHGDQARLSEAIDKIGTRLALDEHGLVFKLWSSCGYTHRVIDCAIELSDARLDPADIDSIRIELPDFHAAILPFAAPGNRREAMFSLPYCVAMGLCRQRLTLDDLDNETWRDEPMRSLIPRVTVEPFRPLRPRLNYDPEQPDRVTLRLRSGEERSSECAYPSGAPENPVTRDQIMQKFNENMRRLCAPADSDLEQFSDWLKLDDLYPLLMKMGGNA